jgi:hypothetical protein
MSPKIRVLKELRKPAGIKRCAAPIFSPGKGEGIVSAVPAPLLGRIIISLRPPTGGRKWIT